MSLAESVRQRLLNRAKSTNETFDLVLTHYGLERLLYRISQSKILDFPPPRVYAYTKYTVVAEKFQAMVVLGMANSRMKDFYDIRVMSQKFDFSGSVLYNSIHSTFKRRGINIPADIPFALTDSFGNDSVKKVQWKAFVRKKKIKTDNEEFSDIIGAIREFLLPPLTALQQRRSFNMTWKPFGPWQRSGEKEK
jgi:hypothetical protein